MRTNLKYLAPTLLTVCLLVLSSANAASAACSGSGEEVKSLNKNKARAALICLFNNERGGRGDLKHNDQLEEAAQKHTDTMRSEQCFSHDCPGEPALKERVRRTGYLRGASDPQLGEVLKFAADEITPREMVNEWMRSDAHEALILRNSFEDAGAGISVKDNSILATVVLGHK